MSENTCCACTNPVSSKTDFAPVHAQAVYFPPCHQREQEFGQPYSELLGLIPGLKLDAIRGNLYCCGLAGVMGFKRDFHEAFDRAGQPTDRKN